MFRQKNKLDQDKLSRAELAAAAEYKMLTHTHTHQDIGSFFLAIAFVPFLFLCVPDP